MDLGGLGFLRYVSQITPEMFATSPTEFLELLYVVSRLFTDSVTSIGSYGRVFGPLRTFQFELFYYEAVLSNYKPHEKCQDRIASSTAVIIPSRV
ncbi:hypothetical protein AC579_5278 [Pseudocercospora musae]|uniref:Uncharacterized protein n=1 Tax=Pseudocercospora musae TaxID=113226 RepID=A0A139IPV3_9PEZI|nr:hypothetical protein AC579_5278 [Pseudocercospora musae]